MQASYMLDFKLFSLQENDLKKELDTVMVSFMCQRLHQSVQIVGQTLLWLFPWGWFLDEINI